VVGIPLLIGWVILLILVLKRCFIARMEVDSIDKEGKKTYKMVNEKWDDSKWVALLVTGVIFVIVA
jgi:hypothetical protein